MIEQVEVIVVDNNSSDGSSEMLKKEFPQVKYLNNIENTGFSKANNKGVALAQGNYVLILNPDTVISETTLSEMVHFSESRTDFGAAGVQFVDGSGKFLPESKRNFPNLKVAGAKLLGYSKYYYANHIHKESIAEVDILTGAFMFIKKKVYEEVGGFDEDFFMYGEDIDLSYRITKAGYKNHYVGSCKVLHFKGESTIKDKFYLSNFYGALSIFYKKHFPNNKALYILIDAFIDAIISVKSISAPPGSKAQAKFGRWAYMGNDDQFLKKLQLKFDASKGYELRAIEENTKEVDIIFFDSSCLTYSDIIDSISNPAIEKVRKRIINRDQSFYVGSDASDERGEAVAI